MKQDPRHYISIHNENGGSSLDTYGGMPAREVCLKLNVSKQRIDYLTTRGVRKIWRSKLREIDMLKMRYEVLAEMLARAQEGLAVLAGSNS